MKKRNHTKRKNALTVSITLLSVLALVVFAVIDIRITPLVKSLAESRAKNIATQTVNDAVQVVLCEKNIKYDTLVTTTKNAQNDVTALTVDTVATNRLCADIRGMVTSSLNNLGEKTVSVPLGTLTGIDVLTGRGPRINVKITLSGSATTTILNDFLTAGINQTRHQMILEVKTKIYAIMQNGTVSAEVANSIVIAETVIVGVVPQIYSDGSDDLWENLIEY